MNSMNEFQILSSVSFITKLYDFYSFEFQHELTITIKEANKSHKATKYPSILLMCDSYCEENVHFMKHRAAYK